MEVKLEADIGKLEEELAETGESKICDKLQEKKEKF